METYVKIQSVQSGPFSSKNNRMIDIDIPEGHLVDMTQSWVQLECALDLQGNYVGNFVANLGVKSAAGVDYTPYNVELIKNASLTSSLKGKLEDVRRVNILSRNLMELSKSSAEKVSQVDSLYQIRTFNSGKLMQPFTQLNKVGSVSSAYQSAFLRVPLSHLFQLGAVDVFDTNKFGKTRIHMELEDSSFLLAENITLTTAVDGPCQNISSVGGSKLTLSTIYSSLEMSPWFVGEKITVVYTPTGLTQQTKHTTIVSINYSEVTGVVELIIADPFAPLAEGTDVYGLINVGEFVYGTGVPALFQMLSAELVIATVDTMKVVSPNELQYMTFTTEEYSVGQSFMNKVFEVEAEAVNCFLMFNKPSTPANLTSNNPTLKNYRLRCDNVDLIDRDVNVNKESNSDYTHDGTHYEMLNRTFLNASIPLKNLTCLNLARNERSIINRFNQINNQIMLVASPVPLTGSSKKYQVNLTQQSGNIENVILYKMCVKSLKL